MGSRIGYNVHGQFVDVLTLKKHVAKTQPTAMVVMDALGLAEDLAAMLPNSIIIHRNYGITKGDDDVHLKVTPAQWIELRQKEADNGVWLYTSNEPAFNKDTIQWHVELMNLWLNRAINPANKYGGLVVGNWAVGNPGPDDWALARPMLELLAQYPEHFILGLHEYACAVITSGLYGGYPNHAGVAPDKVTTENPGKNLIPVDAWPQDVTTITQWHCGRFNFLVNYCQRNGLKPPRIILTEHGMDDVSDIKPWADQLLKTSGYLTIRGWKTLKVQWPLWYPQWSPERTYFEMLTWADRVIYQQSPVEGQCIFSWGHSSQMWDQFDVADAKELQGLLEEYAVSAPVVEPPAPPVQPPSAPVQFPADFATRAVMATLKNTATVNVRSGPGLTHSIVYRLQPKNYVAKIIRDSDLTSEERQQFIATVDRQTDFWLPVQIANGIDVQGWVFGGVLNWQLTDDGRMERLTVLSNQLANMRVMFDDIQAGVEALLAEERNL